MNERSFIGYVRENFEALERRKKLGYRFSAILKELEAEGFAIKYKTLTMALYTVRKERAAGKSLAAPEPAPIATAPIVEKPVVEKSWVSPADLRAIFNAQPDLDAMARAYDAEMKQMKQMKKDQK